MAPDISTADVQLWMASTMEDVSQSLDSGGHGKSAAAAMDGRLKPRFDDVVFYTPLRSCFGHLMRKNAHSRSLPAAISIVWEEKTLKSNDLHLPLRGDHVAICADFSFAADFRESQYGISQLSLQLRQCHPLCPDQYPGICTKEAERSALHVSNRQHDRELADILPEIRQFPGGQQKSA